MLRMVVCDQAPTTKFAISTGDCPHCKRPLEEHEIWVHENGSWTQSKTAGVKR